MNQIINPVIKGFHPDPSIVRAGDDYYIATSTFEWFPGVMIHHSRDLKNWELAAAPLNRLSQLDLKGTDSSEGVWAPCLSYEDGLFYLVYTVVRHWSYNGPRDLTNYLVTCDKVEGDWSEPVKLNKSGFDPSLFHDENGKKWLLNMCWDHRAGHGNFSGILLQEYSVKQQRLTGEVINIFKGTSLGLVEGPHLYKKDGTYYLLTAEGGTRFKHAVTLARAERIEGPYEVHPDNPVLTSYGNPMLSLQKAGHASLVQTKKGEWYMAHLCARPLPSRGRCILGRETALQEVIWKNGWLYLKGGGREPREWIKAPDLPEEVCKEIPVREDFNEGKLPLYFQSLRIPVTEEWLSLTERPGYLRLYGRESLGSRFEQSLIARRQQSFCYTAETALLFEPLTYFEMAGLVAIYDIRNFFYLHITADDNGEIVCRITVCDKGTYSEPYSVKLSPEYQGRYYLKAVMEYHELTFFISCDGIDWEQAGNSLDASILSDDYMEPVQFTGAFVGVCCQDLSGAGQYADFDYFSYEE